MSAKNRKPPRIEDMSQEQLKAFVAKKRECDARAQNIVEEMLDSTLLPDEFLQRLPHINQSHYEDITVERAIIKKCGYAPCPNNLPEKVPVQKYKLSTKTNRVYDITTRKNFCSGLCYKASEYIKEQLLTSPLWFREPDKVLEFKLLSSSSRGVDGEMVDISITEKIPKEDTFTSLYEFTEASLNEMESEKCEEPDKINTPNVRKESEKIGTDENKITVDSTEKSNDKTNKIQKTDVSKTISKNSRKNDNKILLGDVFEKQVPKVDAILSQTNLKFKIETISKDKLDEQPRDKKPENMSSNECPAIILQIEKCFGEWIGFDTLFSIFGETKMRELVSDKSDKIKKFLEKTINESSNTFDSYNQYQNLCKKLNLLELEDKKYDQVAGFKATQPLPDYSILKEESKLLDIKVKAFYKGKTEVPRLENNGTIDSDDDEEEEPHLPILEKSNQLILRRKIFLKGLDKVLPDMLKALNVPPREISGDVQRLIGTFRLEPHNILFKTIQWNLIAMVIIKLLSLRNQRLKEWLNIPTSSKHLQLLLMSYKLDFGYLNRLIWWLTDIDRIVLQ